MMTNISPVNHHHHHSNNKNSGQHYTFISSKGNRLQPKIVSFYESIFVGKKSLKHVKYNFLLLKPHYHALQTYLEAMDYRTLVSMKDIISELINHCTMNARVVVDEPVRCNALATLSRILSYVLHYRLHTDMTSALQLLWGFEQTDTYVSKLLSSLKDILISPIVPATTRNEAAKTLLSLCSLRSIHKNIFFDYFHMNNVFSAVLETLVDKDMNQTTTTTCPLPSPLILKCSVFIIACTHYRKYDHRNPNLSILGKVSKNQLNRMDDVIANLCGMGCELSKYADTQRGMYFNDKAWEMSYKNIWTLATATVTLPIKLVTGDALVPADTIKNNDPFVEKEDMFQLVQRLSHLYTTCGIYLMFLMLTNNNKFVVRTAKLRRDNVQQHPRRKHSNRSAAMSVIPTATPVSLCSFLSSVSIIFSQPCGGIYLDMSRLCLTVMRVMVEDTGMNIVLHDTSLGISVPIASKPKSIIPTALGEELPGYQPLTYSELSWTDSSPTEPLICVCFRLLNQFVNTFVHRLLRLSTPQIAALTLCLDVVYRHLCFQLQLASSTHTTQVTSEELTDSTALSKMYVKTANVLLRLLTTASKVPSLDVYHRLRSLCHQSVMLLRIMLSLREEIFHVTTDIIYFLYEIARASDVLNGFFHMAKKMNDDVICSDMMSLCEVATLFANKVDVCKATRRPSTLNILGIGASSLTSNEVTHLITQHLHEIRVPKIRISGNYQRFVEAESSFFDSLINDMIHDTSYLYLDAHGRQQTLIDNVELPKLMAWLCPAAAANDDDDGGSANVEDDDDGMVQ